MFKKIVVVLFMLFSVKAYAGADDLLVLDYEKATVQDVYRALGNGADVNMQDKDGWTALMHAVWKNNSDVVKVLIDAGADVKIKDNKGKTALTIAQDKGYTDIVEILKSAGAK